MHDGDEKQADVAGHYETYVAETASRNSRSNR
jgi:hypothetical protein